MTFNFNIFADITKSVYPLATTRYSLEEVLSVFRYFFREYKNRTGQDHPPINRDNILRLINVMDTAGEGKNGNTVELDPDHYPPIIDLYFSTTFDNCNYRINHFFSGQVRLFRYYEWLYE